jgi:hypothetical protein
MRARRRNRALAATMLLALVAACGEGAAPRLSTGEPSAAGASVTPDAEPGVASIGPRTGEVANPDIIIVSPTTLSPRTVAAIGAVEGVTGTEQLSLSQTVVENQALTVAAVDPATFRNYTPLEVAEAQEVWDRIAAGELGLRPALAKSLPHDSDLNYPVGGAADAAVIRLGAEVETVVTVDAVVDQTWAPTLGMVEGNALLVRTGMTSPASLRKEIGRLAGDATVSMVDAIALNGLDPNVQQTAVVTGTVADVVGVFRFTVVPGGEGFIDPAPEWVASHIVTTEVPIIGLVTCNKYVIPQLTAALQEIIDRGLRSKIHPDEYQGCYYPKFIPGTKVLSNHSFGLALDFNVPGNLRGTVGEIDRTVVSIFKKWGFAWGGDWNYTDPMHFEMDRLVTPT